MPTSSKKSQGTSDESPFSLDGIKHVTTYAQKRSNSDSREQAKIIELEHHIAILEQEYADLKQKVEEIESNRKTSSRSSSFYLESAGDSRRTIDSVGGVWGDLPDNEGVNDSGEAEATRSSRRRFHREQHIALSLSNRSPLLDDDNCAIVLDTNGNTNNEVERKKVDNDDGSSSKNSNETKNKRKSILQSSLSLSHILSKRNLCTPIQRSIDSHLHAQLTKILKQSSSKSNDAESIEAFRKFILLSVNPKNTINEQGRPKKNLFQCTGSRYMDPFTTQNSDCLDHHPHREDFDPMALSTFCFPSGIRLRLLPRAALRGARRLGWVGPKADRYFLMTFNDENMNANHALAICVYEEMLHGKEIIEQLKLLRQKRKAACLLCRWWRRRVLFVSQQQQHSRQQHSNKPKDREPNGSISSKDATTAAAKNDKQEKKISRTQRLRNMGKQRSRWRSHLTKSRRKLLADIKESNDELTNETEHTSHTTPENDHQNHNSNSSKPSQMTTSFRQKILQTSGVQDYCTKRKQAVAAYNAMIAAERLGDDVCLVETCYLLAGIKDGDQALLFAGLQRLVDAEREERLLHRYDGEEATKKPTSRRPSMWHEPSTSNLNYSPKKQRALDDSHINVKKTKNWPHLATKMTTASTVINDSHRPTEWYSNLLIRRKKLIQVMQVKLCLSPKQTKITYPHSQLKHLHNQSTPVFKLALPIRTTTTAPILTLPLPLPQVATEYGLAILLLKTSPQYLILALKLILVERSLLVVGADSISVTAASRALLELLHPFKWVSPYIPVLPRHMMDFLNSDTPYVAGLILEENDGDDEIMMMRVVREAMCRGTLAVMNLEKGGLYATCPGFGISDNIVLNFGLGLRNSLNSLTTRLTILAKNESSALHSFSKFIQHGFSPAESLTLRSAKSKIATYMKRLSENLVRDDGKHCVELNAISFVKPLEAHLSFHKVLITTKNFAAYVEERMRKERLMWDRKKMEAGEIIAVWTMERWKRREGINDECIGGY